MYTAFNRRSWTDQSVLQGNSRSIVGTAHCNCFPQTQSSSTHFATCLCASISHRILQYDPPPAHHNAMQHHPIRIIQNSANSLSAFAASPALMAGGEGVGPSTVAAAARAAAASSALRLRVSVSRGWRGGGMPRAASEAQSKPCGRRTRQANQLHLNGATISDYKPRQPYGQGYGSCQLACTLCNANHPQTS